jgi:hypothetical protein
MDPKTTSNLLGPVNTKSGAEEACFVLNRAAKLPHDHATASNAFQCIATIAGSDPSLPYLLSSVGIPTGLMKIFPLHLEDASCAEFSLKIFINMTIHNPELVDIFCSPTACLNYSRCIKIHLEHKSETIFILACNLISILANNHEHAQSLLLVGLGPVLLDGYKTFLNKANCVASVLNAIKATSIFGLGSYNPENISSLLASTFQLYANDLIVLEPLLNIFPVMCTSVECRVRLGQLKVCNYLIDVLSQHLNDATIVALGVQSITAMCFVIAIHGQYFRDAGACQLVRQILVMYKDIKEHEDILRMSADAIFQLSTGDPISKASFSGLKDDLNKLLVERKTLSDQSRMAIQNALLRM